MVAVPPALRDVSVRDLSKLIQGSSGIKFEVEGGRGPRELIHTYPLQKSFNLASFFTEIAPLEKRAPAALFLIKQILWFCKDSYVASARSSQCNFDFAPCAALDIFLKRSLKYFLEIPRKVSLILSEQ